MRFLLVSILLTSCRNIVDVNSWGETGSKDYKNEGNQILINNTDSSDQIIEEDGESNEESETTNELREHFEVIHPAPHGHEGLLNCFENASHWAEKEERIFRVAKLRYRNLKEEVLSLEAYIRDYESTTQKIVHHLRQRSGTPKLRPDFLASSGIASYKLTHRYVHMLQRLKELMASNFLDIHLHDILWENNLPDSADGYVDYFVRFDGFILPDWPNLIDLSLAVHSLIHIQEIYDYDYNDLPGILSPETKKPPQLNAFHCAQIGMHAMHKKRFALAVEWMEHSMDKVNNGNDASIDLPLLESYLELAVKMHNRERIGSRSKYTEFLFVNTVEPFQPSTIKKERVSNFLLKVHRGLKNPGYEDFTFKGLCSGEDYRTLDELSNLNCWYDTRSNPARAIQPFKKELLSTEPEVIRVHDVVGEKLISRLVSDKTGCSWSTLSFDNSTAFQILNRFKIPTTCWPMHSRLESLWNTVSSLTHTDLRSEAMSHDVRSVDYLFGRYYGSHRDALQSTKESKEIERKLAENGDRLFTMVFYMNDVPAGGWTPFPGAGTAAAPLKGSVVFWNNLYRNGSAREDTWHGACPVIYGHKQAAVVLVRSHSQFLTYPCTLNKLE